jgi:UDP-N-acetylglucosamine acyltransferase
MSSTRSARIHPTAILSPETELADDVEVGPYVVTEGKVKIGPGCVIRAGAHLIGNLTLGSNNQVFSHAVLGERPQHLKYNNEPTAVEIGDNNIFREHVTIHRGTTYSWATRLGSNNFLMANAHVAHDCQIGNNCILANGALVGGHCAIADNVYMSGNSAVHQFVRIGRLALLSGVSGTSKDIPPFIICQGINNVSGVNLVGMRRAGVSHDSIDAVRRSFQILYRESLTIPQALERIENELGAFPEALEMVAFIRGSTRGIMLREAA